MSNLYSLNAVYPRVQSLYGIDPSPEDFEDIALSGWRMIGNKHTKLYRYVSDTKNAELKLPCNVVDIESVHIPFNDAQMTSNKNVFDQIDSMLIENYIDAWKCMQDPFDSWGKLVKYKEGGDTLYFSRDYPSVKVIYHGIFMDDEDQLPLVNEKEIDAIAAFVAYTELFKDSIRKRDKNSFELVQALKAEWLRKCNSARCPEHLSQNDMNAILDVKHRFDRKMYGKSLKPIL